MVNLTRESVSRVFQLLQGRSIVERDGNDLLVLAPAQLAALAEGAEVVGGCFVFALDCLHWPWHSVRGRCRWR